MDKAERERLRHEITYARGGVVDADVAITLLDALDAAERERDDAERYINDIQSGVPKTHREMQELEEMGEVE